MHKLWAQYTVWQRGKIIPSFPETRNEKQSLTRPIIWFKVTSVVPRVATVIAIVIISIGWLCIISWVKGSEKK
jgi:hypothetical protein